MNWYIIVRRTYTSDRNRLLCWKYVDGISATTHDAALEIGKKRNWWKPEDELVTARAWTDATAETAQELNKARTKDIETFDSLMRRKVTQ
jgi:hypothetical protein